MTITDNILNDIKQAIPEYSTDGIRGILEKYLPKIEEERVINVQKLVTHMTREKFALKFSHVTDSHLYKYEQDESDPRRVHKVYTPHYQDEYNLIYDTYMSQILKFEKK